MKILPAVTAARFEQLEPGEVFLCIEGSGHFYALKTAKPANGDRNEMVLLGPTFPGEPAESSLLSWQPATTLSFGRQCSILLSSDPAAWSTEGPNRTPVCLAVLGDKTYICCNGGAPQRHYFWCFVDVSNGEIVEGRLPGTAAFTNTWELAVLIADCAPLSIMKYPLIDGPPNR